MALALIVTAGYLATFVAVFMLDRALGRIPAVARRRDRAAARREAADLAWEQRMGRPKNAADEWREILGLD